MRLNHGQRGRFRPSRVPSNPLARGGLLHVRTGDRRLQPAGSGPNTAFKAQTRENKFTLLGDPPPEAPTPPQNTRWTGRLQTSPPFQRRASLPGGSRESRPAADSALPGTAPSREPRAAAGPLAEGRRRGRAVGRTRAAACCPSPCVSALGAGALSPPPPRRQLRWPGAGPGAARPPPQSRRAEAGGRADRTGPTATFPGAPPAGGPSSYLLKKRR